MVFMSRERCIFMNGDPMDVLWNGKADDAILIEEAINALRDRLHLDARLVSVKPRSTLEHRYDADIDIIVQGESTRYVVECKSSMDRRDLATQVKRQLLGIGGQGLLITPYVSREIARYCRDIDLQFIDTHGNAYLRGEGRLIYVAGERQEDGMQPGRSRGAITGVAGLRVAFAFLSNSEMVAAPFREIASKAGVSLGAVSNAVEDLAKRGYVIAGGAARRRQLLEPNRLLDEWTLNYPIGLRPKLHGRRYSVPNQGWWTDEPQAGQGAVWGGEVAAKNLTHYLKPATQTIYVEPSARSAWIKTIVMSHRAKPDPNGSLEVLDKFWGDGLEQRPGMAPFALVYADLLASHDPRAAETAQLIRKDWINDTFHPA